MLRLFFCADLLFAVLRVESYTLYSKQCTGMSLIMAICTGPVYGCLHIYIFFIYGSQEVPKGQAGISINRQYLNTHFSYYPLKARL